MLEVISITAAASALLLLLLLRLLNLDKRRCIYRQWWLKTVAKNSHHFKADSCLRLNG